MEASFVVPGPLDVAGTLSRFHLWGEDPANRFADRVCRRAVTVRDAGRLGLRRIDLPSDEVMERVIPVRGFGRGSAERFPARSSPGWGAVRPVAHGDGA